MNVYYNDNEPFVAQWLRNLIAAGHLPTGDVDERPIQEIAPDDLKSYTQCHFFAGIGGWVLALQLARWGDRPVWTGSCPCQPFSAAGKQLATADPRHLWPEWFRLIRAVRPVTVFGEQVVGAIGHGWLDLVSADLEGEGYAVGAAVLGAHSVGAPHIRQRLFFVADTTGKGRWAREAMAEWRSEEPGRPSADVCIKSWLDHAGDSSILTVADVLTPSYGIPDHMGRLRAYGNAIVPQVAAEFIKAYLAVAP